MDHCSNTDNSMGAGAGEQLHDGRVHPHLTGGGHYCCDSQSYSGATRVISSSLVPLRLRPRRK